MPFHSKKSVQTLHYRYLVLHVDCSIINSMEKIEHVGWFAESRCRRTQCSLHESCKLYLYIACPIPEIWMGINLSNWTQPQNGIALMHFYLLPWSIVRWVALRCTVQRFYSLRFNPFGFLPSSLPTARVISFHSLKATSGTQNDGQTVQNTAEQWQRVSFSSLSNTHTHM